MQKKILLFMLFITVTIIYPQNPCPGIPTVTYAGKTYNTVQIGPQCWLKENLNAGTMINCTNGGTNNDGNQTDNSKIEKYCYNNDSTNCLTCGGLYQWAEAVQYKNGAFNTSPPKPAFAGNIQGICPGGWHIPSNSEFEKLDTVVNNDSRALKAIGQGTGNGAGTDKSGFSALLAGGCISLNSFGGLRDFAYFWSSSEYKASEAHNISLSYYDSVIYFGNYYKGLAFSIRCLKD